MSAALLDVNVLVALFQRDHPHSQVAHRWFRERAAGGWATCGITENGLIRVMLRARQPGEARSAYQLGQDLKNAKRGGAHVFWESDLSIANDAQFDLGKLFGVNQLTDVYLLGLAVRNEGVLVTFDQSIPMAAVRGARAEHLEVLSA